MGVWAGRGCGYKDREHAARVHGVVCSLPSSGDAGTARGMRIVSCGGDWTGVMKAERVR